MFSKVVTSALQVTFILALVFTLPIFPIVGAFFGFLFFLGPVFILAAIYTPFAEYLERKNAPMGIWIISTSFISTVYFLSLMYLWSEPNSFNISGFLDRVVIISAVIGGILTGWDVKRSVNKDKIMK